MGNVRTALIFLTLMQINTCHLNDGKLGLNVIVEISWNALFDMDSDHYFILVYSESCAFCNEILTSLSVDQPRIDNLYTIAYASVVPTFPNPEKTIGATSIEDVWIYAVPTLIEITNKTVTMNVYGSDDVLSVLYSYKI